MMTASLDHFVVSGKIGAPHGLKGWVKVFSYTDPIENLLNYFPWQVEIQGQLMQMNVVHHQVHGNAILVGFEGVTDRDQAAALTHGLIYIERAKLPALPDGQYYWIDLEGLEVRNLSGFFFGCITELMSTGANDVMFIKGEKEYCLPYIPTVIKKVDLAKKQMLVDWPEELE